MLNLLIKGEKRRRKLVNIFARLSTTPFFFFTQKFSSSREIGLYFSLTLSFSLFPLRVRNISKSNFVDGNFEYFGGYFLHSKIIGLLIFFQVNESRLIEIGVNNCGVPILPEGEGGGGKPPIGQKLCSNSLLFGYGFLLGWSGFDSRPV